MIQEVDLKFLKKLSSPPALRRRFEEILNIAHNTSGELISKEKLKGGNAIQLVADVDGSMVTIVETALPKEGKQDKRRCRSLKWKEARLCFVRGANQVTPVFYATMGDVERDGQLSAVPADNKSREFVTLKKCQK